MLSSAEASGERSEQKEKEKEGGETGAGTPQAVSAAPNDLGFATEIEIYDIE